MNKEDKFEELIESARCCRLCSRLRTRQKSLNKENGNLYSNVLFIAEAPGRVPPNILPIPMDRGEAGGNFRKFLKAIGWEREEVFVTNAALCNRANDTPNKEELKNCSLYLSGIIEIIDPDCVITLGRKALEAVKFIEDHKLSLRANVGRSNSWYNRLLIPLYHPSPRAMDYRTYSEQLNDFRYISRFIER